jgi:hypothetical protein
VADLSSYKIDTITAIEDSGTGLVIETNLKELKKLPDIPQKQDEIYWTKFGRKLYLYKGTGVTSYGTLTMFYSALPTKATLNTDTLDIPDKFVDLVIQKAKVRVYEVINKAVPESLSTGVENKTEKLRNVYLKEMDTVKSSKNKTN